MPRRDAAGRHRDDGAAIVFLMVGGVASDRLERRWILVAADALRALAVALLAGLGFGGLLAVWHVVALASLYGVGSAFHAPRAGGGAGAAAGRARRGGRGRRDGCRRLVVRRPRGGVAARPAPRVAVGHVRQRGDRLPAAPGALSTMASRPAPRPDPHALLTPRAAPSARCRRRRRRRPRRAGRGSPPRRPRSRGSAARTRTPGPARARRCRPPAPAARSRTGAAGRA
ncbi:hypothetical protein FSW04_09940 [Baekduia soli]|uniref:MFS transporter n=1 Tax=Baekduia soli TaxID=496014 RepID=A0A5B8UCH4_9ACTN|nr:hypothetical protein FSW04_09940 [Baekduia soli]